MSIKVFTHFNISNEHYNIKNNYIYYKWILFFITFESEWEDIIILLIDEDSINYSKYQNDRVEFLLIIILNIRLLIIIIKMERL
jgi:hypothetical protein